MKLIQLITESNKNDNKPTAANKQVIHKNPCHTNSYPDFESWFEYNALQGFKPVNIR